MLVPDTLFVDLGDQLLELGGNLEHGIPIAVVEAKVNKYTVSHGMQQAISYAEILKVPSAFSSNGDAFASHNKVSRGSELIETELPLDAFPPPATVWQRYKTFRGIEEQAEDLVCKYSRSRPRKRASINFLNSAPIVPSG